MNELWRGHDLNPMLRTQPLANWKRQATWVSSENGAALYGDPFFVDRHLSRTSSRKDQPALNPGSDAKNWSIRVEFKAAVFY